MKYEVHFGKAYPLWLNGVDRIYHRIRTYDCKASALRCLNRANNCKLVEWTDMIIQKST